MDYETRRPLLTDSNLEQINYYNQANKIPDYNSKLYYKYFQHPCFCKCHCHFRCHNSNHNFFYSRNKNINQIELDLKQKYELYPQRNKSLNNLLYSQNNNSLEELKRKYYNYYNENKNNNKKNQIYNYKYKNDLYLNDKIKKLDKNYSSPNLIIKNNEKTDNINNYNNYTFKDIRVKNNDLINNNNNHNNNNHLEKNITNLKQHVIKPSKSFQIKRKELSQYYHISNPRKYSYGGEILETVNNADNHKYKEVIGTSNSKDKIINKSRVIYNSQNNNIEANNNNDDINIKIETNNNNNYLKDKLNNHKYINYRYKSYQNSPKKLSRNILYEPKEANTDIKKKIIKETYNTRLIESKELKKSPTEKYLYNLNNDDIKYRINLNNIFNQNKISNGIKNIDNNNNNNNYLYQNNNKYKINNINNFNKISNSYLNENNEDINLDYDYYKINNYKNYNSLKNLPKSYSFNNLKKHNSYNLKNIKNNYQTDYDNKFSNNDNPQNQNKQNNNVDYEMIKLKVKLALLRKQMYEQERERIFNDEKNDIIYKDLQNKKYLEKFISKGNIKPNIANNNSLFERTKKLLEAKKLRNLQKELNNKNKNNNENKILYSLKKNLREKSDIYKNDMIKPRLKICKQ